MTERLARPSLLREGAASFAALAVVGLLKVGYNVAVGRGPGVEALGIVNVAIAWAFLASMVAQFTAGGAQRFVSDALGRNDSAGAAAFARYGRVIATALAATLATLVGFGLVAVARFDVTVAALAALIALTHASAHYGKRVLFAYGAGRASLRYETWGAAAFTVTLVPVIVFGVEAWLLLPFVAHFAVFAAAAARRPDRVAVRVLAADERVGFLRYAGETFVGSAAVMGTLQASVIVTAWLAGPEGAGLYAAAFSLMTLFLFLPQGLQQALFPALAFRHGSGDAAAFKALAQRAHRFVAALAFLGAGIVAFEAPRIMPLLFGPGFAAASGTLAVLVTGVAFSIAAVPAAQACLAMGASRFAVASGVAQVLAAAAVWATAVVAGPVVVAWGLVAAGVAAGIVAGVAVVRLGCFSGRETVAPFVQGALPLGVGAAVHVAFPVLPEAALAAFAVAFVALNVDVLSALRPRRVREAALAL